jgi:hypothetical protein
MVRSRVGLQRQLPRIGTLRSSYHLRSPYKETHARVTLVCYSNWLCPSPSHHELKSGVAYSPAVTSSYSDWKQRREPVWLYWVVIALLAGVVAGVFAIG